LPISAVDTISLAAQHTKRQLMQPFRFGQWVRLAFVGLLAGEMGSGGGCNTHNFKFPQQPVPSHQFLAQSFPNIDPAIVGGLIAVLVVTGLVFLIVMTYISSVMRFILFDSVLAKGCHVGEGWSRRQGPGWRYFLWQLGLLLITLAAVAVLVGIPALFAFSAGWFKEPQAHVLGLVLGGIAEFLVMAFLVVTTAVVHVLTKDFVVPQMALEGIGAMEGWRRLWPMIEAEMGGYAAYVGLKIVLAILAGIIIGIAGAILGVIVAIPSVALGIVAVVTGKSAGLTWNAMTITVAVVVVCMLVAIFLFLMSLVAVPAIVFFPAYSIYFFASRYQPLSRVLYPPPPPATAFGSSGGPPPTPAPIG